MEHLYNVADWFGIVKGIALGLWVVSGPTHTALFKCTHQSKIWWIHRYPCVTLKEESNSQTCGVFLANVLYKLWLEQKTLLTKKKHQLRKSFNSHTRKKNTHTQVTWTERYQAVRDNLSNSLREALWSR